MSCAKRFHALCDGYPPYLARPTREGPRLLLCTWRDVCGLLRRLHLPHSPPNKGSLSGPDGLWPCHHGLRLRQQRGRVRGAAGRDAPEGHDADARGLPRLAPRLRRAQKVGRGSGGERSVVDRLRANNKFMRK